MDWKDVILKVAPTVATALGSPLAGAAVTALGSIFGISNATEDNIKKIIESGQMTGDQLTELRKLEMQYQNEEKERGFKYAELAFKGDELDLKDVVSAREREIATQDKTNQRLAFVIVASFLVTSVCVLAGWAKVDSVLAGTIIGYVSAKCEQVLAYYFGSTRNSARKTELLAKADSVR